MYAIISGIMPTTEEDLKIIEELHQNQLSLQSEGFFSSWNPEEAKNYVKENHPHNHSTLVSDHTETHGHRENALVIIQEKGYGFAKNKFIKETDGMQAFAYTSPIYEELADKIASSPEESRKIKLALWVNLISVANVIIKPDQLAVFM